MQNEIIEYHQLSQFDANWPTTCFCYRKWRLGVDKHDHKRKPIEFLNLETALNEENNSCTQSAQSHFLGGQRIQIGVALALKKPYGL